MAAVLPRPDHIFEANFWNTDDGPVWSNLSDYVEVQQGLKIGKRRQNVFDDVAPATLTAFLDNSTGAFNNDRVGSPFFGQVNLDVPVRFRIRWPNCPSATANMLGDTQSLGSDATPFTADQGTLDTDALSPPAGQGSDITWTTGPLGQTGVSVMTGVGSTRGPDDHPIYIKPNTSYSARVVIKDDTNGTGITFKASLRMRWFDIDGTLLSDSSSALLTLTTSYQSMSVTATSPATAVTVRVGVFNETIVAPTVRAISWDGGDTDVQHWGTVIRTTIPASAEVGDLALVFVRANNPAVTINTPAGWTLKGAAWTDSKGKTALFYRVVTATDISKNYPFTTSAACGFQVLLSTYSGVSQSTLIHQFTTSAEGTFRTTHTTPNVTTTIASCWIVSAAFDTSSTTTAWGAPGGENVRSVGYRTGGNSPTGIISDNGAAVAAGTYGSKVFTANSSSKAASMATVALAPAAGTGPGSVLVQIGKWELVEGSLGVWAQGGHWESKFTGGVDSWKETFAGDLALMQVAATDRQKQLNTINISSAVYESIRSSDPIAYYRLDESGAGAAATQEAGNYADTIQGTLAQKQYGTGGTISWGQGTGPAVDGTTAVMFAPVDGNNGIGLYGVLTNPIVRGNAVSMLTFFNSSQPVGSTFRVMIRIQDATNGQNVRCQLQIQGSSATNMLANATLTSEGSTYQALATKSANYFDGKTHCLAATFQLAGGQLIAALFIDGIQQAQTTVACPIAQFPTLSVISVGSGGSIPTLVAGTYSHAAWFNTALDPTDIANINTAGTTAFAGDTIDQRIGRLCDWENQDGLALDGTLTVCARHMPDSKTLLAGVQEAARSEGGTVYIDGEGLITFNSRASKEQTAVPLITVTAGDVLPTFVKSTDDELLVNKPVIKRLDTGVTMSVTDIASQTIHGLHEKDVDTILSSNDDALNYATYLLAFYSVPQPRCDQVTIEGLLLQDWQHVLLIDMWQIIRITGLPAVEQVTTIDLFIEGWEFDISGDSWSLTFDTSTAIPFAILNDAARGTCGSSVVGW